MGKREEGKERDHGKGNKNRSTLLARVMETPTGTS